jgi:hypothetical protein
MVKTWYMRGVSYAILTLGTAVMYNPVYKHSAVKLLEKAVDYSRVLAHMRSCGT